MGLWQARICAICSSRCSAGAGAGGEAPKRSLWNLLYQDCVKNPYVWLFAIAYFFVYVVRQGVTSWFIFYLQARRCIQRCVVFGVCWKCAFEPCACVPPKTS